MYVRLHHLGCQLERKNQTKKKHELDWAGTGPGLGYVTHQHFGNLEMLSPQGQLSSVQNKIKINAHEKL